MSRLVFHLLLVLTLVLNGLAAPWALAATQPATATLHGTHHGHHGQADAVAAVPTAHHAHSGHRADLAALPAMPDPGIDCCTDAACHCGCLLPPVLPLAIALVVPQGVAAVPSSVVQALAGIRRASPPLRPPAA